MRICSTLFNIVLIMLIHFFVYITITMKMKKSLPMVAFLAIALATATTTGLLTALSLLIITRRYENQCSLIMHTCNAISL